MDGGLQPFTSPQNLMVGHMRKYSYRVGMGGFEPPTSWSRTKRAAKLRYIPTGGHTYIIEPKHHSVKAFPALSRSLSESAPPA